MRGFRFLAISRKWLIYAASTLSLILFLTLIGTPPADASPGEGEAASSDHQIHVEARQFEFSPGIIRVQQGSTVRIELSSHDVTHGLYLEGYDLALEAIPGRTESAEFVAERPGRFRFYCSVTCGQLHPFMRGELIVEPESSLPISLGLLPLALLAGLFSLSANSTLLGSRQIELTSFRPLKRLLQSRALHQSVVALLLAGLSLAALAGIFGSKVGSHNFAIVFVWIVWWGLLKLVLIPFGGRLWCSLCPLPAPGEWLQRRAIVTRGPLKALGLGRAWPHPLRGAWLGSIALLLMGVFSTPILTNPALTGWVLAGLAGLSLVMALIFRGRAFCRYLCPVGGFVGLYSLGAPIALRVKDPEICLHHEEKECLHGSESSYGCPWHAYPGQLGRNIDCGLCFECLRACPKSNVGLFLRPFGADIASPPDESTANSRPRLDEAYGGIVMFSLALVYTLVFFGPISSLRSESLLRTPIDLLGHSLLVIGGAGLVAPALWLGVAAIVRLISRNRAVSLLQVWSETAKAFLPLGLLAWASFTVSFVLSSGSYIPSVISDPLGQGWSLLGIAGTWEPLLVGERHFLQLGLLLLGLFWAGRVARRSCEGLFGRGAASFAPTLATGIGLTIAIGGLAWLGLG